LDDLGLIPALEMLVRIANTQQVAEVYFEHAADTERLGDNTELAIYRIAQEALHNAMQHSQAQHITIRLVPDEGGINLKVTDNGVGFTPSQHLYIYTQQGHFGLVGIQERVRQLNGELSIMSHPGKGTALSVHIPDIPCTQGNRE
jgi:signal transduction histidine kinase